MVQHADIDHTGLTGVGGGGGIPPIHGWRLTNAADQTVNNNAAALDTEVIDTDGYHSGSATGATIPTGLAGYYFLQGVAQSSTGTILLLFRINGSGVNGAQTQGTANVPASLSTGPVFLDEGDVVDLFIFTSGSGHNIRGVTNAATAGAGFAGFLIGQ